MLDNLKKYGIFIFFIAAIFLVACEDDETPEVEDEVEVITKLGLIFTNDTDPTGIVMANAMDPDCEGIEDLEVVNGITLTGGAT